MYVRFSGAHPNVLCGLVACSSPWQGVRDVVWERVEEFLKARERQHSDNMQRQRQQRLERWRRISGQLHQLWQLVGENLGGESGVDPEDLLGACEFVEEASWGVEQSIDLDPGSEEHQV